MTRRGSLELVKMIKQFSHILVFAIFIWSCSALAQDEHFSTDVEELSNELKQAFQQIYDPCIYDEVGKWIDGCLRQVNNYVIFGSFSQAGAREAYVRTSYDCGGCIFSNLFAQEDNQWVMSKRHVEYFGSACLKFTTLEQRDLLTCYVNGRAEMDLSVEIWALDFSKAEPKTTLLYFEHPWDESSLCGKIARGAKSVIYYEPVNWMPTDFDADGDKDLYFVLDTVEITQKHCVNETVEDDTLLKALPRARKDLIWLLDGETFTPTPETQAFLETLQPQQ